MVRWMVSHGPKSGLATPELLSCWFKFTTGFAFRRQQNFVKMLYECFARNRNGDEPHLALCFCYTGAIAALQWCGGVLDSRSAFFNAGACKSADTPATICRSNAAASVSRELAASSQQCMSHHTANSPSVCWCTSIALLFFIQQGAASSLHIAFIAHSVLLRADQAGSKHCTEEGVHACGSWHNLHVSMPLQQHMACHICRQMLHVQVALLVN